MNAELISVDPTLIQAVIAMGVLVCTFGLGFLTGALSSRKELNQLASTLDDYLDKAKANTKDAL